MKWLLIVLLTVGAVNMPLLTDVTVKVDKVTVYVQYEANPANTDVTVAVTALDNTPPEWASATVYHVWFIDTYGQSFNDVWPNMKVGHFRVRATLHRDGQKDIVAPAVDVEVK